MNTERRDFRRALVGPEHTIQFLVKGRAFQQVRITNLSPGGCFATIPGSLADTFSRGTLLEQFAFEHPDLPHDPFTAQVAFTLLEEADGTTSDEFMGLGIHFVTPPRDIELGLDRVLRQLGA